VVYPDELEIKDSTKFYIHVCVSYLDILIRFDSDFRLTNTLYDKRDSFNLQSSAYLFYEVVYAPVYSVHIFQLTRYARACFAYEDDSNRGKQLAKMLML
jgi:hypothetical protein